MILLSLLLVLSLEFHFKVGSEYRDFSWFEKLQNMLADAFAGKDFYEGWGGLFLILLLPCVILYGFVNIFDGVFYWLIYFIVSICVLFLSLGPTSLEKSLKPYFDAVDEDSVEAAYLHSQSISSLKGSVGSKSNDASEDQQENVAKDTSNTPEVDELVRNTTKQILIESQIRYFGVIAWFIFFGPYGALFYRLAHLYSNQSKENEFDEHSPLIEKMLHWINWIPARITSFLFLLTGDFVNGFYRIKDYLTDALADNWQLIAETGVAAQSLDRGISERNIDENTETMELVHRTAIIYLVFAALVSTLT
ncbi:MAG: regulatory signaling modulator protein AmpE [Kangiellaceae bacterium]